MTPGAVSLRRSSASEGKNIGLSCYYDCYGGVVRTVLVVGYFHGRV
jgi:hypothetical protein